MRSRIAALLMAAPGLIRAAEQKGGQTPPEQLGPGTALQVLLALLLVLALIGAMAWMIRRFGNVSGVGRSGPLKVITAVSVGQRERVVLIEVGERQLLLGVAPGRVEKLHVLEQPVDVNATNGGERFSDRFAAALRKRGGQ